MVTPIDSLRVTALQLVERVLPGPSRSSIPHVQPIAEYLHAGDLAARRESRRPGAVRPPSPRTPRRRATTQPAGLIERQYLAFVQERDAAHRSASSRYGVDIRMVMPERRNCDSSFQNSRRDTGSTPVVGSSSRITWARAPACRPAPASVSFRRKLVGQSRAKARQLRHLEQAGRAAR